MFVIVKRVSINVMPPICPVPVKTGHVVNATGKWDVLAGRSRPTAVPCEVLQELPLHYSMAIPYPISI
jgi:hypothetical protein